jgi:uncharacterized membrane protein
MMVGWGGYHIGASMCFVLCHQHLLLAVCKVCYESETDFIKKNLLLKFLHFNIIPFKVVPSEATHQWGVVLPPLEAYCWNFSSVRSFLVSFIALWMLSIVLNCCPHRQFVILEKRKKLRGGRMGNSGAVEPLQYVWTWIPCSQATHYDRPHCRGAVIQVSAMSECT